MIKFDRVSYKEFKTHFPDHDEKEIMEMYENIKLPERSTKNSAGYDFYLHHPIISSSGIYPTGIKAYMPDDVVLLITPRSSLGFKHGFRLCNTIGVIDSDYVDNPQNEGHILIGFQADKTIHLRTGDKLCQGIFIRFLTTDDDRSEKIREGGIGSTGK